MKTHGDLEASTRRVNFAAPRSATRHSFYLGSWISLVASRNQHLHILPVRKLLPLLLFVCNTYAFVAQSCWCVQLCITFYDLKLHKGRKLIKTWLLAVKFDNQVKFDKILFALFRPIIWNMVQCQCEFNSNTWASDSFRIHLDWIFQ